VLAAAEVAVGVTLLGGSRPRGRFTHELTACSLLTDQQIHAYVPGAASGKNVRGNFCEWDAELDPKQVANHVIVFVEGVAHDTGGVPCVRRQPGNHADCQTYVRVSNAIFCVQVQSTTGDAVPASRALAAEAVRRLPPH
jgi:hypothetical protein